MLEFNLGLSALQASQQMLTIIGQNIANANTPGYHAEVGDLTEQAPTQVGNLSVGSGVDVATVQRLQSAILDSAVAQNSSVSSSLTAQLNSLQQVQSLVSAGTGSTIPDLTQAFFDQIQQLTANPGDSTARQQVLAAASALTQQLNSTASGLNGLSSGLTGQIGQIVTQINGLTQQIGALNGQIGQQEALGQTPNTLLDQRDEAIQQLASLANIQTVDQGNGETNVLLAGMTVVSGSSAVSLSTSVDPSGATVVMGNPAQTAVNVSGGSLGGMLQIQHQALPQIQQQLNQFTRALEQNVDEIQATGIGLAGPQSIVSGTRGVSDPTIPLGQAGLAFPPHQGSLDVTMTNLSTGQSTTTQVAIDPATQSLDDLATALNQVPDLQALVNSQDGTIQLLAQSGYGISFISQNSGALADTAGILPALGLNTFFDGANAADVAINPALQSNPQLLAAGTTSQPGDSSNLQRLVSLGNQPVLGGGSQTFTQFATEFIGQIGSQVQQLTDQQTSTNAIGQQLQAQQQAVSGVDPNQQLVRLLQYQNSFQMASQYISAVNQAMDSLLQLIPVY
jgi:flagellar hook-associated protein FlgK